MYFPPAEAPLTVATTMTSSSKALGIIFDCPHLFERWEGHSRTHTAVLRQRLSPTVDGDIAGLVAARAGHADPGRSQPEKEQNLRSGPHRLRRGRRKLRRLSGWLSNLRINHCLHFYAIGENSFSNCLLYSARIKTGALNWELA